MRNAVCYRGDACADNALCEKAKRRNEFLRFEMIGISGRLQEYRHQVRGKQGQVSGTVQNVSTPCAK